MLISWTVYMTYKNKQIAKPALSNRENEVLNRYDKMLILDMILKICWK